MPANDSSKTLTFQILVVVTALLTLLTALLATRHGQGLLGGPAQAPAPVTTPVPAEPLPKAGPTEPAEKVRPTKRPTTLTVLQKPDRRPNTLVVIKVRLATGDTPLAERDLSVFRAPFEPRAAPLAVARTGADGVLTLPLPGVGGTEALRVEFPGDTEHEPAFVEIRG